MAAAPVMKAKRQLILVASEKQRLQALARWSAPVVADSPDRFFELLNDVSEKPLTSSDGVNESKTPARMFESNRTTAEGKIILDLKTEAADIRSYIVSRVAAFDPNANDGPGGPGPIKMVYAGYEFDQAGWFVLVFETRPNAAHDGEWTSHIENNCFARPQWVTAGKTAPISIRNLGGKVRKLHAASQLGILLRELIQQVMLQLRDEGVFASLPLLPNWELDLEEFNGSYGWSSSMKTNDQPQEG